jgi:hypothetical protein
MRVVGNAEHSLAEHLLQEVRASFPRSPHPLTSKP